jgi:predicted aminopeptidase
MAYASRKHLNVIAGGVLCALFTTFFPGSPIPYLLKAGRYQADMLMGALPHEHLLSDPDTSPEVRAKLHEIAEILAFSREIGLNHNGQYETINPSFQARINNVVAAQPLSFTPKTWWFPIVGTVPYLGFFEEGDALDLQRTLNRAGFDTTIRTAGAYSTLGWFKDPILPHMLSWSEYRIANTLLHELTHATTWIRGSAEFNESFANYVGQKGANAYLSAKYGATSQQLQEAANAREDQTKARAIIEIVKDELEQIYEDVDTPLSVRRTKKSVVLASIPFRLASEKLHDSSLIIAAYRRTEWNNATLIQFGTYNSNADYFDQIFQDCNYNIDQFVTKIDALSKAGEIPIELFMTTDKVD